MPPLRSFALRLVVIAALLLACSQWFSEPLVRPLLPLFAWTVEQADDHLAVQRVEIDAEKKGVYLSIETRLKRPLQLDAEHWLFPDTSPPASQGMLVGAVLQPLVVLLAIVLAWPARTRREALWRGLLSLPAAVALVLADAPLGLAGALLDFRQVAPAAPVSPLVHWNDFLQSGGPLAMAICAAVLVVALGERLGRAAQARPSPAAP
ncbi:MAG: hypothetical protein JO369_01470 [Paucibacter sp.]|nr:hypothetical protein [Roseateles sp.]